MQPREFIMTSKWGDRISWSNPKQFDMLFSEKLYNVNGHKTPKPQVGDTLKAEFHKSWVWFKFESVEECHDSHDMFFAQVRPIRQEQK